LRKKVDVTGSKEDPGIDVKGAKSILVELLQKNKGSVSTRAFIKKLEQKGFESIKDIVRKFKFSDDNDLEAEGIYHKGRSFFNEKAYHEELEKSEEEADQSEKEEEADEVEEVEEEVEISERRRNKKEEARLVTYVKSALENIYDTQYGPEAEIAFDVHNDRAGNSYENVDLIAIDWRSDDVVETIAVEAKLYFNVKLVQQAKNYTRFADRVWIAVNVKVGAAEAAAALREENPLVFDYVVDSGIGILGCKRNQGKSYDVFPIHWPSLNNPNKLEKNEFIKRHLSVFQEAKVVAPESKERYPKL
jgi:hypothetical protein